MERDVSEWQAEIHRAKEYQRQRGRISSWKQAQEYYFNNYPKNVISVNLIFAIGRALVPQLYFKTPTILATSGRKEMADFVPIVEAADRQLVAKMGMKQQIKLGILDAYLTNIAVFKFGYHSIGTELPTVENVETGGLENDVLSVLESVGGSDLRETVEESEKDLRQYSYHDWINPNTPWMLRVRPEDFLVPSGTLDKASAPWCAFRVVRPIDDVMKDPLYTNKEGLTGNATLLRDDKGTHTIPAYPSLFKVKTQPDAEILDAVEFWEIWDKRSGKIIVIHEDRPKAMRNELHNLPIKGLPVELLQFNPTGWDFWGPSDVDQIVQQQMEYNETRTIEMNHKKTAITKLLYNEGAIEDTELTKLMSPEQVAVAVKGGESINNVIKELNPNMSPDLFRISDVIRTDISETLGFSRNQAGEFDVSRRTATEAGIVQRALEIRSDERRDLVADFIAAAFQNQINPIIFQQWTEKRSIEVTGKQGWVTFSGPQIKGDYMISVVADSVVPLTQAQKQQAAVQALQMFKDDPRVDQNRLYAWVFTQFQSLGMPSNLLLGEEEAERNRQAQLQAIQAGAAQKSERGGTNGRP